MDRYRVIITPRAGKEINEIYDHVSKDSPKNAALLVNRILDSLEPLKQFPHRTEISRQRRGLRHPVRSLAVDSYIIFSRVLEEDSVVLILSVRHGARRRPRRFE